MMPLILAAVGTAGLIKRVGGSAEIKKHLESLGFVPGGSVTVITMMGGNLIVNVKDARIAISREMASKIMVDEWKLNEEDITHENTERGENRRHHHRGEAPWRRSREAPDNGHGHH